MSEEQKYKCLCINSWRDERKPENEIQEEDISDIYYVSLYCEPKHNQFSSDYDYDWWPMVIRSGMANEDWAMHAIQLS